MTKTCGIYKITETETGKCYIGQSVRIQARWKAHNKRFPLDTHTYEVVQECCIGLLDTMERFFIKKWNTLSPSGLNRTVGGSGMFGHMDEEMRRKISEAAKGNTHNKGRTHSEETRRKVSEAAKRRKPGPPSEETKHKMSEAMKGKTPGNKGKPMSEEQRRKISETLKKRNDSIRMVNNGN